MARRPFGGTSADFVLDRYGNARSGVAVTFWTAKTGGSQVTDIQTAAGGATSPAGTIVTGSDGIVSLLGPDDGTASLWADAGGGRVLMLATDDPVRLAALESGSATSSALTAETAARVAADALLVPLSQKGAASGVASLDGSGTVPDAQLPASIARDAETTAAVAAEAASRAAGDALQMSVVVHSATAGTARPSTGAVVHWIGSVLPTNSLVNDQWTDTATNLVKRCTVAGTTFVAAGSGTYETVVSADAYGVPTDGTTDATSAIIAAFAGAVAAGRKLVFTKRTYVISGVLDLPSNLTVDFGMSTLLFPAAVDRGVSGLRCMGTNNITVRNVTINCNRAARNVGSGPASVSGEWIAGNGVTTRTTNDVGKTYASDILFENVHVIDPPNHGWEIVGAERVRLVSCTARGAGDDNFSIGGLNASGSDSQPAREVTLVGCVARASVGGFSSNSNGFEVDDGANHVTLVGCVAEANLVGGFQIHGHDGGVSPHHVTISGCTARNNPTNGIRVETQSGATDNSRDITLTGNTVEGSTNGIWLRTAERASVTSNTLSGQTILVNDGSKNVSVVGNVCAQIFVSHGSGSGSDIVVEGNTVLSATGAGIHVAATGGFTLNRVAVVGNVVRTTTTEGIYVQSNGGTVTDAVVNANLVSGHGTFGIRCNGVVGATVHSNTVRGVDSTTSSNTESILVQNGSRASIVGNTVHGGNRCLWISSQANTVITGNRLELPGDAGIYLVASGSSVITGNRIVGGPRGVDGVTSGNDTVVTGNVFSGQSSFAIRQQSTCDYWAISGNNYRGIALSMSGANNVTTGNVV